MPEPLDLLTDGPTDAAKTFVFAHGAGAPMNTDFMNTFAVGLAEHGIRVVRFEFPYMAERRRSGRKPPPNPQHVLRATFHQALEQVGVARPFVGGKSMGGRIASMLADEARAAGVVCLGYPFHPVGKPQQLRIEHLQNLATPTLIVQGDRDPFGTRDEVAGYRLSPTIHIHWVADGDHGLVPRKASGRTTEQNWAEGVEAVVGFIEQY